MIKSNSRKALERIRKWIRENYHPEGYDGAPEENAELAKIAAYILDTFQKEKPYTNEYARRHNLTYQIIFFDWCAGLPSILDTAEYIYRGSAADLLGEWLEETEEEKARYTETDAENMITRLLYRELTNAARKAKETRQ